MSLSTIRRAGPLRVVRRGVLLAATCSLLAGPALAAAPGADFTRDSTLTDLVREALANRPEVAQAQAMAKAEAARVPQAGALPDPVVSLGVQNDGFDRLRIGEMEQSWWSVGAAQTIPWYGKRTLRARTQSLEAGRADADLERIRLTARADVERAYLDLLLVRDQLAILVKLEVHWMQAEGLSRSRYETGTGAQSDVLRTQLGRSRLQQQRWALVAEERRRVAVLNRVIGREIGHPIPSRLSLGDLSDPALPDSVAAEAEAEARNPELRRARLGVEQSRTLVSLARKDYFPDFTVSGAVMPRSGEFESMWQAGLSLSVPVWAAGKQSRAVGEYRLRGQAAERGAETVRRLLRLRLEERRAQLVALLATNGLYRSGLLVQSDATVSSTMAQYRVGTVPFASVLEALNGYLADLAGFYESVAAAQRVDIAQREFRLESVAGPAPGGLGGSFMPGSGGTGTVPAPAAGVSGPTPAGPTSTAMPRM